MQWALEQGIQYVLPLNGDARLHPDAIAEMLTVVEHENNTVVACPRMYGGSASDDPQRLWFAYGTASLWAGIFRNPAFGQIDSSKWSVPLDMEWVVGCCLLIPRRILQGAGMFDEAFFAYYEDVDLSLRIRKAGFRLRYVPTAHIWHGSLRPPRRDLSEMYRYLSTRNSLWVMRKHASRFGIFMYLCLLPCRSLFRIMGMMIHKKWRVIGAELKGIIDGIFAQIGAL